MKVYKWELLKLLAQKRTYLGLGAAMLVPLIFVTVLILKTGGPNDIPLGRYIRQTGLATPFVVLFFMSIWAFPLITALVAGDIVASESHNGTLKTILTRSRNRGEIFAGEDLRDVHVHGGGRLRDGPGRVRRREHRMGLQRSHLAVGNDGQRLARPRAACGEPRDLCVADGGDRGLRPLPVDRHAQQCGSGGRHADVGAADAAARRAARAPNRFAPICSGSSSRRGTASSGPRPTGRRSCVRSGSARCTSRSR